MIKANELRIGNLVYPDMSSHEPITVCIKDFEDTSHLKPIPLTEEWLLKFGFGIEHHLNYSQKEVNRNGIKNVNLAIIRESYKVDIFYYHGGYETPMKYVHQLQNLYFALTNEELKIEL